MNVPTQSVIFSGLKGVGKTVLINKLQKTAEDHSIFCRHIEVEERNDFISQIASCFQAFLRRVSTKEKFKNLIQKPLDAIKSLVVSFDPNGNTFSLSMQEKELYKSINLTQSLTEVFVTIGETAYKSEVPICFFIDEIQYMKSEELGALIAALHRTNQLGYPVMVIGA
jgi:predicted AAA+ superfamily ATPase